MSTQLALSLPAPVFHHPPAGQRYPLRDQDVIHLGPDTQLQVIIEASDDDVAGMTVEQKLTADAERAAASIRVRPGYRAGQGLAGMRTGQGLGGTVVDTASQARARQWCW